MEQRFTIFIFYYHAAKLSSIQTDFYSRLVTNELNLYWSFLRKSLSLCTCIGTQRLSVKIMAVIQITSREFREKQASMFALADKGAQVVIRRRGKVSYLLTPVYDNDYVLSPEVEERLEEGRKQYKEGNVTTCRTKEELNDFLESL